MDTQAVLTFWGCRGSISSPGYDTKIFGGNTPCITVEYKDQVLIFDAGTGIRNVGNYLIEKSKQRPINAHLFISHFHGDHVEGLPFFRPLYQLSNRFSIYGEGKDDLSFADVLRNRIKPPYFPVELDTLFAAGISYHEVCEKQAIVIDEDMSVMPIRLIHPNGAIGFRIQIGDLSIAYVTDHEHEIGRISPLLVESLQNTDILIHDAQYDREAINNGKQGWGHSAWEDVVDFAHAVNAGQLFLFHHDPESNDEILFERQRLARQARPATSIAREGLVVALPVQSKKLIRDDSSVAIDQLIRLSNALEFKKAVRKATLFSDNLGQESALLIIRIDDIMTNRVFDFDFSQSLAIKAIALQAINHLRMNPSIGRYRHDELYAYEDGNELAIILHDIKDPDNAQMVVTRIAAILSREFVVAGENVHLEFSIGVLNFPKTEAKKPGFGEHALQLQHRALDILEV